MGSMPCSALPEEVLIVDRRQRGDGVSGWCELRRRRPGDVRIGEGAAWNFAFRSRRSIDTKVVLLTVYDRALRPPGVRVGASVTSSSASTDRVVGHLRRVCQGETVIDHALAVGGALRCTPERW